MKIGFNGIKDGNMRRMLFWLMRVVFTVFNRICNRWRMLAGSLCRHRVALFLLGWGMCAAVGGYAQRSATLCGFVEDAATGERLPRATLYEAAGGRGVACNDYGFYSMTLPRGRYTLRVDYVGYLPRFVTLDLQKDTAFNIGLGRAGWLEEAVVEGKRPFVEGVGMGRHDLSVAQIKAMPAILGETDVMKSLQALPGVNSGQEGTAGVSVRGGSPEQTEVLLDGMPVYNVNHLFGYFSIFNGEALQGLTLYKGAVPARYGGRLSSVLDVSVREGNMREFAGTASVSPLAATLTVEGPIKRDEASYIVSARYSWLNALIQAGSRIIGSETAYGLGFYDANAKVNWKPTGRDRLFLSLYNSRDAQMNWDRSDGEKNKQRNSWGNIGASLRWNRVVDARLFANTQLYYSRFRREDMSRMYNGESRKYDVMKVFSHLEEWALKSDWDFMASDAHRLHFGGTVAYKKYRPETSFRRIEDNNFTFEDATYGGLWSGEVYAEDEWKLSPHLEAGIGVRGALFRTEHKTYWAVEPRLALAFLIDERNSLKASWSRMTQPLHLLTSISMGAPSELWVPVTDKVKPGRSDLFSLGYYRQLRDHLELSAEVYYNDLQNVIRYKEGTPYIKQKDASWQDYIYTGKGRGYGVELMLNKTAGALNGWLSYTWSKSERSFDGIRKGEWFPFEYDRRHKLNVAASYTFREVEEQHFLKMLSLNFTYASGNYTTVGRQYYPSIPLPGKPDGALGSERGWEYMPHPNNVQLPDYHHLDVAFHLKNKKEKGSSWTFGIYNLYGRKNPGYYYWTEEKGETVVKRLSICLFIPCISWSYRF